MWPRQESPPERTVRYGRGTTGSGASETLILFPSERCSAGRALYYEDSLFFKYLLPADDLKYLSLKTASSLVLNPSL